MPFTNKAGLPSKFKYTPIGKKKDGRPVYKVTEDGHYHTDKVKGFSGVQVHEGFITDLASIPSLPFFPNPAGSLWDDAAIVHDKLCVEARGGMRKRSEADAVFYHAMIERGCTKFTATVFWMAVRVGGTFSSKGK